MNGEMETAAQDQGRVFFKDKKKKFKMHLLTTGILDV